MPEPGFERKGTTPEQQAEAAFVRGNLNFNPEDVQVHVDGGTYDIIGYDMYDPSEEELEQGGRPRPRMQLLESGGERRMNVGVEDFEEGRAQAFERTGGA